MKRLLIFLLGLGIAFSVHAKWGYYAVSHGANGYYGWGFHPTSSWDASVIAFKNCNNVTVNCNWPTAKYGNWNL